MSEIQSQSQIKNSFPEELQTTIFDIGSYNYRIGYSGNDRPSYIFPPIKMVWDEENRQQKYEYLTSQSGDGLFVDVVKFEEFLNDFILDKKLTEEIEHGSLLFSEPLISNKNQRLKLTEFLFEKYQIAGLFVCNTAVLSSFSYGKSSCLVFDSGHNQSNIAPVHDGMIVKNALVNYEINGKYVDNIIIEEILGEKYEKFSSQVVQSIQIFSELKEKIFFPSTSSDNKYILPDQTEIILDENNIKKIYDNIHLKMFNNEFSINKKIIKSVSLVNLDIKKDLINNIFICGGNSLVFNIYFEKIKEELSKELIHNTPIKITTHPSKIERSLASFLGASIISSLNIYQDTIIKKDEYEEHGAIIIERKCA